MLIEVELPYMPSHFTKGTVLDKVTKVISKQYPGFGSFIELCTTRPGGTFWDGWDLFKRTFVENCFYWFLEKSLQSNNFAHLFWDIDFFEFTGANQHYERSAGPGLIGTYAETGRLSLPGLTNFDCTAKFIAIFYIHSKYISTAFKIFFQVNHAILLLLYCTWVNKRAAGTNTCPDSNVSTQSRHNQQAESTAIDWTIVELQWSTKVQSIRPKSKVFTMQPSALATKVLF